MDDLNLLLAERERLWLSHPIIMQSAILPTRAVQHATKYVLEEARKSRASVAFWADPLSGKTSCLRMIEAAVKARFPGCGVLNFEAVEDDQPAEGRLHAQLLIMSGYALRIDVTLAGKRAQVQRSLIALAGSARHLFLLADEAQEISNAELGWLKAVINGLTRENVKVTSVLAGQRELVRRREELMSNARSDLGERFMKSIFEFQGCKTSEDLKVILEAVDVRSTFPEERKWTYTQLLFPRAYLGGFRFGAYADKIWTAIGLVVPPKLLSKGLRMEDVASVLAQLCIAGKDLDAAGMVLTDKFILAAVERGFER